MTEKHKHILLVDLQFMLASVHQTPIYSGFSNIPNMFPMMLVDFPIFVVDFPICFFADFLDILDPHLQGTFRIYRWIFPNKNQPAIGDPPVTSWKPSMSL